jgi:hypothetical protein
VIFHAQLKNVLKGHESYITVTQSYSIHESHITGYSLVENFPPGSITEKELQKYIHSVERAKTIDIVHAYIRSAVMYKRKRHVGKKGYIFVQLIPILCCEAKGGYSDPL